MKPDAAKTRFLERLAAAGLSLDTLTPAAGAAAMLEFYADERADGCDPNASGDMLLIQWFTFDWEVGREPTFDVFITRQLIAADDPETEPRQLKLRFRYEPAVGVEAGQGSVGWCESLDGLPEFRRQVIGSAALRAAGRWPPKSIHLWYERT